MGTIDWVDLQDANSTSEKPTRAMNAANTEPQMSTLAKSPILYPAILTAFSACAILIIALFLLTHNSCCHKKRSSKAKKDEQEIEEITGNQHTAKIVYNIPDTSHPKLTSVLQQENNEVASEVNEHYQVGACNQAIICCPDKDGYIYDPRHRRARDESTTDETSSGSMPCSTSPTDSSKEALCTTRGNKSARSEPVTSKDKKGVSLAIKNLTEALHRDKKARSAALKTQNKPFFSQQVLNYPKARSPSHRKTRKKSTQRKGQLDTRLESAFRLPDDKAGNEKGDAEKCDKAAKTQSKNKKSDREKHTEKKVKDSKTKEKDKEIATKTSTNDVPSSQTQKGTKSILEQSNSNKEASLNEETSSKQNDDNKEKSNPTENVVKTNPNSNEEKPNTGRQRLFSEKELKNIVDFKGLLIDRWVDDTIKRQGTSPTEKESEATWEIQTQLNLLYDDADSILTSVSRMDEKRLRRLRESKFYDAVLHSQQKEMGEKLIAETDKGTVDKGGTNVCTRRDVSGSMESMKHREQQTVGSTKDSKTTQRDQHVDRKEKETRLSKESSSKSRVVGKNQSDHKDGKVRTNDSQQGGNVSSDVYLQKLSDIPTTCREFFDKDDSNEHRDVQNLSSELSRRAATNKTKHLVNNVQLMAPKLHDETPGQTLHAENKLRNDCVDTYANQSKARRLLKYEGRRRAERRKMDDDSVSPSIETSTMQSQGKNEKLYKEYGDRLKNRQSHYDTTSASKIGTGIERHDGTMPSGTYLEDSSYLYNKIPLDESSISLDHKNESLSRSPRKVKRLKQHGRSQKRAGKELFLADTRENGLSTQQTLETIKERSTVSDSYLRTSSHGDRWTRGEYSKEIPTAITSNSYDNTETVKRWDLHDHIVPDSDDTSRLHVPISRRLRHDRKDIMSSRGNPQIGSWIPRDASTGITEKVQSKEGKKKHSERQNTDNIQPSMSFSILKNFKEHQKPILYVSLSKLMNLTLMEELVDDKLYVRSYLQNHSNSKQESKPFEYSSTVQLKELFVIKGTSTDLLLNDKLIFEVVSSVTNRILGRVIINLDELNSKRSLSRTDNIEFVDFDPSLNRHTM